MSGEPWCELCIHHALSSGGSVALGVGFFLVCATILWLAVHWQTQEAGGASLRWFHWMLFGVGATLGAFFIGTRKPKLQAGVLEVRDPDAAPQPLLKRGHPYRAALRRTARLVASPVSGVKTAVIVVVCMLAMALALPRALLLPRIVEFELVLAAFWLLWGVTSSVLLYRNFRIANDHVLAKPRAPWKHLETDEKPERWRAQSDRDIAGCIGCGHIELFPPLLLLFVAFGAAWLVIEVVLPGLLFLVYFAVRSALAAVANDDHDCQGHLGLALGWGFAWSTVYILPVAGTLALVHLLWH